ncbi:O-antigen polymerase [Flavobacterium sp.]|uniref:O-antigen polymerase n=1 Tax=Flavobacterium sp. TaxID=239 RepID=UPI003D144559
MRLTDFKYLIYVPSFHGFATFLFFYICYFLGIIEYNNCDNYTHLIYITCIFFFLISSFLFVNRFKTRLQNTYVSNFTCNFYDSVTMRRYVYIFYAIGNLGFVLYLQKVISFFGGVSIFLAILLSEDSTQIRIESDNFSDSIGIQLSYFSWIAAAISLIVLRQSKNKKKYIALIVFTFLQNVLFIDRTRPMWIILTLLISVFPFSHRKISNVKVVLTTFFLGVGFYGLFSIIAVLAGKSLTEKQFKGWDISPSAQNFIYYGTSSFAYFNNMVENEEIDSFKLDRTVYPLLKITSSLGITDQPSSLVNDFYFIPSPTNVGTFLEPFYRDGGFLFVFFGMFFHSVILNALGVFFLKNANPFGLFAYANICYVNLMAFFTPKINNFPIWLFLTLGIYFMIYLKKKLKTN